MSLTIDDPEVTNLVDELARRNGVSHQDAVRLAVTHELEQSGDLVPLRERLEALWRDHPLPPKTGQLADKAFFDELSGEP